ncbi:MAG: ABC-type transport auxiliary lipoprotein family protein [Thermodesulfobacteriota bacterium]
MPNPFPWMKIPLPRGPSLPLRLLLLAVLPWLFLAGCGKPPALINNYMLEYPAPLIGKSPRLDAALKVELFAVAQAYNSTAMVYRPSPFKSEVYNYSRWRVNPGYLVTDFLLRDLRNSGLFPAVLSYHEAGNARFRLEGGVEEFQELDEADGWKAALVLNVTLLDLLAGELPQRLVFQKSYRAAEPLPEKTPQGLAQGMSRALEKLSARIITDTYDAARQRTTGK